MIGKIFRGVSNDLENCFQWVEKWGEGKKVRILRFWG
jgi:hypothetical protein